MYKCAVLIPSPLSLSHTLTKGRGKTTLLSVLRSPGSALPDNVSTVGVEVAEWVVHPPAHLTKKKGGGGSSQRVRLYTTRNHVTVCIGSLIPWLIPGIVSFQDQSGNEMGVQIIGY